MKIKALLAIVVIFILIITIFIFSSGMSSLKSKISTKAPEFKLKSVSGKTYSLKDYKNKKVVVISFFATWCGPCRMELPVLQSFYEKNKYLGIEVFAINIREDESVIQKLVDNNNLTFPILLDRTGNIAREYKVRGIPALFIIDKNGKIAKKHVGLDPNLEKTLKEEIIAIQ